MSYTFPRSTELFSRAQKSIVGGINSGIRKMEAPVPLYFDHGKGSRLWDVDGNEYIDFQTGQGALLYGHAPAGMAEAIAEQAKKGTHWAAQCELEIEVAERLQKMIPGAERVRFNNSATEVVLAAFRLARAHTGRKLILKFEGHYHGWADEGLVGFAPPPDQWGTEDEPTRLHPSQGVIPEVLEQFVVARWNDPEHLRKRVDQYRGQIAAIVFEPVLCNTSCIPPVSGLLQNGRQAAADRYSYLACMPFAVAFGLALERLKVRRPRTAAGVLLVVIGILAAATARQAQYWRNDITLWTRAVGIMPTAYLPNSNLSVALLVAHRGSAAIPYLEAAIRLEPRDAEARVNLAAILASQGDDAGAIRYFGEAVALRANDPSFASARYNLGVLLIRHGHKHDGLAHVREAVRLNPSLKRP